ncbi:MAG: hypothetical protein K2X97_03350, partial [Mycobacteriaceae bacterium]|nr:hypothetical protein [Mycobacteriaceae bacterium]
MHRFNYLESDGLNYLGNFPMIFPFITSLMVDTGTARRETRVMPCLSRFSRLKALTLDCCNSSFSQKNAPKSLQFVELLDLKGYRTDLHIFKNVYKILIEGCQGSISLDGLEHVPRVILQDIDNENLHGLGQNDYVQIVCCFQLKDFSAIKYVREVHIETCPALMNAEDLSDVHTLTIVDCANLVNVSSLRNVQNLELNSCHAITSVSSIENIPHLKVTDCEGLKSPLPSTFGVDLGIRVIDDRLTRLPDCLYREICNYLPSEDQFQLICCNTYLYQKLIKHQPLFLIKGDR